MARAWAEIAPRENCVLELVETVGRLSSDDQERMLRMVTLMARAPRSIQIVTQQMLRQLLDTRPKTAGECIVGIDAVIEYLEANEDADAASAFEIVSVPTTASYN